MNNIQSTHIVTAIDYGDDPRLRYQSSGISGELREISNLLKEGLEGFSAWIQIYALMSGTGTTVLENAARELNRMSEYFTNAYLHLMNYLQQIPQPRDMAIAVEIEQLFEKLLLETLPKETLCELAGFGWTSWAERIDPHTNTVWSVEMATQLLSQLKNASWQKARELLAETKSHLP
jgi:hypothetical protein